jgi:hypothetical protein
MSSKNTSPLKKTGDRLETFPGIVPDSKFSELKRKEPTMPINRAELIEELENNIRKYGGAFGEWCVGTAKDARGPFFQRHLTANLGDGLAYREAFTTDAAQAVVVHLVNHRGLQRDPEGSGQSAVGTQPPQATPEPGKIVFVYRKTAAIPAAPPSDHAAFPRRAA